MFSKDITENDAFLDMPLSTQALYFHLGMEADDDGFVSPSRVMRMIGAQQDDLRLLVAKKFLLQFPDGVVVVKHWRINNYLRSDRYKETTHKEKKEQLTVKNNDSYTWYTNGIPLVAAGKDRIGKDTLATAEQSSAPNEKDMPFRNTSDDHEEGVVNYDGDANLVPLKKPQTKKYPNAAAVRKVFLQVLGKNPANWKVNKTQLQACENLFAERGLLKIKNALEYYQENKNQEYCPQVSTPYDLDGKWAKLGEFKKKHHGA